MSQPSRVAVSTDVRRLRLAGIVLVLLIVLILAYGFIVRAAENSSLRKTTEEQAVPNVAVVTPSAVENRSGLDLPGRLEAYIRAPIYARVPGYLKSWKYDIGSKVKAGAVLAEATLSFLGLGPQPPTPEWGAMLSTARNFMTSAPFLITFPGLAILVVAVSFNLMGDGLRDALDPRLRQGG